MFAFEKNTEGFEVKKGLVLFQVIGQYGVKTLTTQKFKEFLSSKFNVMPFFYTVSTREAFEKLIENGSFKKLHLIKNEVDPEFSNMLGINGGKEVKTIALAGIKEKKGFVDKILDLATSDKEVYEIDDEYDDISLTIDMGGRTKTTSIRDIRSLYIVEKVNAAMIEHANDYLDNIVEGDEIDE